MAWIYPENFTIKYRNDGSEDKSEELVFKAFKNIKNDEIKIFHSRNYLMRNLKGYFMDGETADFLVFHPKKGILFFESKNMKNLSYNNQTGIWKDGDREIRDPIDQAKTHRHLFLSKIKQETNIKINIPTSYGVILPRTEKQDFKRSDIEPELIIWKEDFLELQKSLDKIFNLQKSEVTMSHQDSKKLESFFKGTRSIKTSFKNIIDNIEDDQKIKLSDKQEQIMSLIFNPRNKKVAVEGHAGTGKTILLAERATDQVNKNKKVLILTKTKPINKFLKLLTTNNNCSMDVVNVDQLVKVISDNEIIKNYRFLKANKKTENISDEKYYNEIYPNFCFEIFNKNPEKKYDLVLVDEAQDFHKNWFEILCFSKKEEGQIVFFYDPFQIQIENSMIEEIYNANDISHQTLRENFRNTIQITKLLQRLLKKYFPESNVSYQFKIEQGEDPLLITYDNWDDQINKLSELIKHLINKDKIIPRDIAVIYDGSRKTPENATLNMQKEIEKICETVSADDYSEPYLNKSKEKSISLDKIARFKGLEKKIIILTNIENFNKENAKDLYTGLSRARAKLYILSSSNAANQFKDLLAN